MKIVFDLKLQMCQPLASNFLTLWVWELFGTTIIRNDKYRIVASSNTSRLEAHTGFFRLLMKGIFYPYVLWPFDKELIS